MSGWRGAVLTAGCLGLLAGCYRSAEIPLADVQRIVPEGEDSLHVHRAEEQPLIFDGYDTVEVEAVGDTGYEFERPVSARLQGNVLQVSDTHSDRTFRVEEVEELEIWQHAPDR